MTRKVWLLVFVLAALCASACSSRRAPADHDPALGFVSSELFALGVPCGNATQCTSGFCVDGVCCDTACGAGARDLQACSNIYGAVPGLVNGTCKTLAAGNACGSLTTVDPCTWRGTTVNGGNNCPNPPGGSAACFPCVDSGDCSGGFPICVNNACVSCTGDNGSAGTAPCPAATPACTNGQCVQCTAANVAACAGGAPTCDLATNTCGGCNGDNGSGATRACATTAAPACVAGQCVQCTAAKTDACTGLTPACDVGTNQCAGCNGDNASGAAQACPTIANPFCKGDGSCGKCAINADCIGHPNGAICGPSGACGASCALDTDCIVATQWCAAGVCLTKTANGELVPNVAPVNATCNVANGLRVCASGVCDTADNRCGLKNGATCGPPPNGAQCRSATCFAADNKCGLPAGQPCVNQNDCRSLVCPPSGKCADCQNDAACGATTSGKVCDDIAKTCGNGCRGTGGNGCPTGQTCTSKNAAIGKCVKCLDDAGCGSATSGQVCNDTQTCVAGCRGSGGNGCPMGQACSSVDGTIGTCGAVSCTVDASCGAPNSGLVCNEATKTCQAGCRGPGTGNTCPIGQVCSSTNAGIGTCGPPPPLPPQCTTDTQCGVVTSGRICNATTQTCVDGCRGVGGNACAADLVCSSTSATAGTCAPDIDTGVLEGGGFSCAVRASASGRGRDGSRGAGLALLVLGAALVIRRRTARA